MSQDLKPFWVTFLRASTPGFVCAQTLRTTHTFVPALTVPSPAISRSATVCALNLAACLREYRSARGTPHTRRRASSSSQRCLNTYIHDLSLSTRTQSYDITAISSHSIPYVCLQCQGSVANRNNDDKNTTQKIRWSYRDGSLKSTSKIMLDAVECQPSSLDVTHLFRYLSPMK